MDYSDIEASLIMQAKSLTRDSDEMIQKMRVLDPGLIASYLNTDYIVHIKGERIVVRIMENPPNALKEITTPIATKSWAIITADNPYSEHTSTTDNQTRQNQLEQLLLTHKYQIFPAIGKSNDSDWQERGFLIIGITYEIAKAFGTCFQQNAIVFGHLDHPVELVFCDKGL